MPLMFMLCSIVLVKLGGDTIKIISELILLPVTTGTFERLEPGIIFIFFEGVNNRSPSHFHGQQNENA